MRTEEEIDFGSDVAREGDILSRNIPDFNPPNLYINNPYNCSRHSKIYLQLLEEKTNEVRDAQKIKIRIKRDCEDANTHVPAEIRECLGPFDVAQDRHQCVGHQGEGRKKMLDEDNPIGEKNIDIDLEGHKY